MNPTIEDKTTWLFVAKKITNFDSKAYVNWAMFLLENGLESESLVILAGLDFSDTEERERYFYKALDELNIDKPTDEEALAEKFMINLSQKVLNNEIEPRLGLDWAVDLVVRTGFDGKYTQFIYLDEDLDNLLYQGMTIFNTNLSIDRANDHIKKEFELWHRAYKSGVFDIIDLSYCLECNAIITPDLAKKRRLFKALFLYYRCPKCKSTNLLNGRDQEGRIKILEAMNKG